MPRIAVDDIEAEIEGLRHLDLDELRLRWRATFRRTAPTRLPRHLLLRLLAYRLQAQAWGDLDKTAGQFLDRIARRNGNGDGGDLATVALPEQGSLKPGTLLVRDHDGVRHHVMVVERGFAWNGGTYPSLSKVAHAITGTNWNGPRFFGLRDKNGPGS
jgi:hypothetical protein